VCSTVSHRCVPVTGCATDADCPATDWCKAGTCTPKLPEGFLCDSHNQCQSSVCEAQACGAVVASGSGACAIGRAGGADEPGALAAAGLVLAALGLLRRRRR
jgi:hypothetical protein